MNVDNMFEELLAREGGYVNDPRDAGGETNFGITVKTARANGYTGPMKDLTKEQALEIYRNQYWRRPGFAAVAIVYPKVAEELVDTGVNMGPGKASEFLQIALNALNNQGKAFADIKEDGDIGPATMQALRAYKSLRGEEGELVLLRALNCLQGARYIELARQRSANEAFLYGWLRTRVSWAS